MNRWLRELILGNELAKAQREATALVAEAESLRNDLNAIKREQAEIQRLLRAHDWAQRVERHPIPSAELRELNLLRDYLSARAAAQLACSGGQIRSDEVRDLERWMQVLTRVLARFTDVRLARSD